MPRISREREDATRRSILEAGIDVFERRGFAKAGMSEIAREAGMAAGSIYTYFGSKEELFLNAFGALVEDEERMLQESIAESPVTTDAIDLAIDYVARVAAGGEGFRGAGATFLLHAWNTADQSEALREMLQRRRSNTSALARTVIDGATARGELPAGLDAEGLALGFTSLLDGLFLQRAERGDAFSAPEARRQVRAVVDAMFHAAGPT
ncbi:MAG: TetR/AcrR family transcriptional regulator [Candidatus Limnocylindrales bacterium]